MALGHVAVLAFVPGVHVAAFAVVALGHVGRLDFVFVARILFIAHAGFAAAPGWLGLVAAFASAPFRTVGFAGPVATPSLLIPGIGHHSSSSPCWIDG
jgi:hypothetical protein